MNGTPNHPPRPTDMELEILRALWDLAPATVRQVHERLNTVKPTGYTTVLKLLQIMFDKGLVIRNQEARAHVYSPAVPAEQTKSQLAGDLLRRAFAGSAADLVLGALSSQPATRDELDEIRRLLDEYETKGDRQ